jgi:hypothetical protein
LIPGRAALQQDGGLPPKGSIMMLRPITAAEPAEPAEPIERRHQPEIEMLGFAELYGPTLDLSAVDLVIAPLVGLGFDWVELIEGLSRAGFRGQLRVTARWLPDGDIVLAELPTLADPVGISVSLHIGPPASWSVAKRPGAVRS